MKRANLRRWTLDLEPPCALALGSGFGAAAGFALISPLWLLLLLAVGIFLPRRGIAALLAGVLCGMCAGVAAHWEKEALAAEFDRSRSIAGVITVRDNRATEHPEIALTSRVRGGLVANGSRRELPVLITFPERSKGVRLLYGDRFEVRGVLNVPASGGFYFDRSGIGEEIPPPYAEAYILKVDTARKIEPESSVTRWCFKFRDVVLTRVISGIASSGVKRMAARLFLGASEGASFDVKREFVLAGIIHLFAVSGMHVGIFALVAGLCLRFLPLKIRHLLLAGATLLYVAASGMAVPALRAGGMIICWALLRAFLFHTPNRTILALAYFALCVIEPGAVGELGVQYSFGITAVLIWGMGMFQEYFQLRQWRLALMPGNASLSRDFYRENRRLNRFTGAVAVATAAFVSSSMLTMRHSKLFLPGGIFTNLLTLLLTPLLFVMFLAKVFSGWMGSWLDGAWGELISWGFGMLKWCSGVSITIFDTLPVVVPPWYAVAIFYILLFLALLLKNIYVKTLLFIGCGVLMLLPPAGAALRKGEVIVISGSSGHPPLLAYLPPGERRALVCNVPDTWSGVIAADELLRRGCDEAELFFSSGRSGNSAGVKAFSSRIKVTALHLPEDKGNRFFHAHLRLINGDFLHGEALADTRQARLADDGSLAWDPAEGVHISVRALPHGNKLSVSDAAGKNADIIIPWCNHLLLLRKRLDAPE